MGFSVGRGQKGSGEIFCFKPIFHALHEFLDAQVGQGHAVVGGCRFFLGFRAKAIVAFDDKADARGVRRNGRVFRRIGDVLAGEAETAIEAGDELKEVASLVWI